MSGGAPGHGSTPSGETSWSGGTAISGGAWEWWEDYLLELPVHDPTSSVADPATGSSLAERDPDENVEINVTSLEGVAAMLGLPRGRSR